MLEKQFIDKQKREIKGRNTIMNIVHNVPCMMKDHRRGRPAEAQHLETNILRS